MRKKFQMRAMSIFLAVSFILSSFLGVPAAASTGNLSSEKGKYYGKELKQKERVKDVYSTPSKTKKSIRKPVVEKESIDEHSNYSRDKEVLEKRTEVSKTFKVDSKTEATEIYLDKIHYKDASGKFVDIDNTLVGKGKNNTEYYENKGNDFKVTLPSAMSKDKGMTVEKDGKSVTLYPFEGDFSRSGVSDSAILYNDVFEGIDYQYTIQNTRVKEDIILNHYVGKNIFKYYVAANGLELREESNTIRAYEGGSTEPAFILSAPAMIDASGKMNTDIQIHLEKDKAGRNIITVTVDKAWLEAKDRAYPVKIDPEVNPEPAISATYIQERHPTINYLDNGYLYAGNENGVASGVGKLEHTTTFMKFPVDSILGKKISSATLTLQRYTNASTAARSFELYSLDQPLNLGDVTWDSWLKNSVSTSYITEAVVSGTASRANPEAVSWNITDLVQKWCLGVADNGIQIKTKNYDDIAEAFSGGEANAYVKIPPKLTIMTQVDNPVDPATPLDNPTVKVRALSHHNNDGVLTLDGVFADGVAKPGASVSYALEPQGTLDYGGAVSADESYKYPDSDLLPDFPAGDTPYKGKESNWQTSEIERSHYLALNTLYRIKAVAELDGTAGTPGYSDYFQIYQVQAKDTIPYIANYYGVDPAVIKKDNSTGDSLLIESNLLFIRNPQKNAGKAYTPAPLTDAKKREIDGALMGRGKHCEFGFEPVNLNTGNFYYTSDDVNVPDLNGNFTISRHYNALGDLHDGYFGSRWDFDFNKSLSMTKDFTVIYSRGDGSTLYFHRNDDGSYAAPAGENYKLIKNTDTGRKDVSFDLIENNNITYTFNNMGLLKTITDKKGNVTALSYDDSYRLTGITTPSQRTFSIKLDESGRITSITLPNGSELEYGYDDKGNLTSFTDADGNTTTYNYDENGRMLSFADPNGNKSIQNTYDSAGRVIQQTDANGKTIYISYKDGYNETTDANGNKTDYYFDDNYRTTKIVRPDGKTEETTYDENNNVKTVKDALGHVTTYEYDSRGNKTKETRFDGKYTSYTYDDNNNPTSITDFNGKVTTMQYDEKGNLLKVTRPDKSTMVYTYNEKNQMITSTDPDNKVTTYEYNGADISQVKDPKGNAYHYYYDAMGKVITVEDPAGNITRMAYSSGGKLLNTMLPDNSVTEYGYDKNGNNISITDANKNVTVFEYDKLDHIIKAVDPENNATAFSYDANGNKTQEADGAGHKTLYEYDSLNRMSKVIDADSGESVLQRDALGNITASKDPKGNWTYYEYNYNVNQIQKITDTLNNVTKYDYDDQGNVLKVTYSDGTSKQYVYDDLYRVKEFTDITGVKTYTDYDGMGRVKKLEDSLGRVYQYEYDDDGNLVSTLDPLSFTTKYIYDKNNRISAVTDAENNTVIYNYNNVGRLSEVLDPLNNKISYGYDANGNLTAEKDAKGNVKTYYYDPLNRLKAVKDTLQNITQYSYDASGNMNNETDPVGNETKYEYNGKGLPVKVTDAAQNTYQMQYDMNGNRIGITDPSGGVTAFEYDVLDRLISQTDSAGVKENMEYDSMGRMLKSEDNAGNIMTYTYDDFGRLTEQKDTIGRTVKYEYDSAGNITKKKDIDNNETTYEYDKGGRVTKITDAEGKETIINYDGLGRVVEKILPGGKDYKYKYDAAGNLAKTTDPLGTATDYVYDASHNLTGVKNAAGYSKKYQYDAVNRLAAFIDERNNTVSYQYDPNGNLTKKTDAMNNSTQYLYDSLNRLDTEVDALGFATKYKYDSLSNVISKTDGRNNETKYEYNKHGLQTKVTDALGGITKYEYNLNDNLTKMTDALNAVYSYTYDQVHRITSITDPAGYVKSLSYDGYGNTSKESDNAGNARSYTYDKMHRLLTSKDTAGNLTSYTYDSIGNLASVKQPNNGTTFYEYDVMDRINKVTDPEGKVTQMMYDVLGNVSKEIEPGNQTYQYQYDEANNLKSATNPLGQTASYTYNKNNQMETAADALGNKITYTYNAVNMVSQVKDAVGNTTSYAYDGSRNLAAVTDGNNHTTSYQYDALNRLTKVTNPLGNNTAYTYDAVGNRTSVTDGNGHVTNYTYDSRSKLTSSKNPIGEVESYTYNLMGNLTSYTKPDGSRINYDYDVLNRLASKEYTDSQGQKQEDKTVTYQYDAMGNRTYMNGGEGESDYTYDSMERITSVNLPTGDEVKYEYDSLGRKSKMIYPDGKYVIYSYDGLNRINCVENWKGEKTYYNYDAAGRRTETILPNGVKAEFTYDAANRIVKIENIGTEGTISIFEYKYDGAGNIVSEVQHQGEDIYTRTYTYDSLNEITGFTEVEKEKDGSSETRKYSYGYDAAGNRIAVEITGEDGPKTTKYTFNEANELLFSSTGKLTTKYEYDKNGNRVRKILPDTRVIYYDYDEEDRLTQLTNYDGYVETYGYDSDGSRIYKTGGMYFEPQVAAPLPADDNSGSTNTGSQTQDTNKNAGTAVSPSTGSSNNQSSTAGSASQKTNVSSGSKTSAAALNNDSTADTESTLNNENASNPSVGTAQDSKAASKDNKKKAAAQQKKDESKPSVITRVVNAIGKGIATAAKAVKDFFVSIGRGIGNFFKGLLGAKKKTAGSDNKLSIKVGAESMPNFYGSGSNNGKGKSEQGTVDNKQNGQGNDGSGNNGNGSSGSGSSSTNNGSGQDNGKASDNSGKDNGKGNQDSGSADNGNNNDGTHSNGNHNGWDKHKDNGNGPKGNNGLHLGWYKNANNPHNPANQPPLNNTDSYEIINYINDISLENAQVIMTSDKDGNYDTAYTNGLERISEDNLNITDSSKNDPLFYINDGRANVTELVDSKGITRDRYRYDPFGNPIPKATVGPNPVDFNNPYRYSGEDTDITTGLQYLRARYYDPQAGDFLSRDSYLGDITDPLTLNRYTYVSNNPVNYVDPSGHHQVYESDDGTVINYFGRTTNGDLLRKGSTGEEVRSLQNSLMSLGFGVGSSGADGKFGNATERAVRAFQSSRGLAVDGIAGDETWRAIRNSSSASINSTNYTGELLRRGSNNDAVRALQSALINLGYDLGPSGADGKFGTRTEKAVLAFQRSKGLDVDGIVGQHTWAALAAASRPDVGAKCDGSDYIPQGTGETNYVQLDSLIFTKDEAKKYYYGGDILGYYYQKEDGSKVPGTDYEVSKLPKVMACKDGEYTYVYALANVSDCYSRDPLPHANKILKHEDTYKYVLIKTDEPKILLDDVLPVDIEFDPVDGIDIGEYDEVGGHHIHAKAAFRGDINYNPGEGFAISQDFMEAMGWSHADMTAMQRNLFKELYESGRANTLEEHTRIALESLKAGGATEKEASSLVELSLLNLEEQGVTVPTRIPWYSK